MKDLKWEEYFDSMCLIQGASALGLFEIVLIKDEDKKEYLYSIFEVGNQNSIYENLRYDKRKFYSNPKLIKFVYLPNEDLEIIDLGAIYERLNDVYKFIRPTNFSEKFYKKGQEEFIEKSLKDISKILHYLYNNK